MLPRRRVWRELRADSWTETSGLYSNSAERYGLDAIAEAGDQWPGLGDGRLHRSQRQGRLVTGLAVPDLGDPESSLVGWITGNHVAQAAGHGLCAVQKDSRECVPLP